MTELGCICRDPSHPNIGCMIHGRKVSKAERTPASGFRKKPAMKRSKIADKSTDEVVRAAVLNAIKTERVRAQIDAEGTAWCERCEQETGRDVPTAKKSGELHHQDERRDEAKGYNYRSGSFGCDDPEGLLYVCKKCHRELEKEAVSTRKGEA